MSTVNSGLVLRLLPKTSYDFSKIIAGAGNNQVLTLAQHIDVAFFAEATFIIRAHAVSIAGAASIVFGVVFDGYEFGDPGVTGFLQPNVPAGGPIAQLTMNSSTTGPFFNNLAVPVNFARFLAIQLTGNVPVGAVGGTCTISVDLSLKGGDPSGRIAAPNTFLGYATSRQARFGARPLSGKGFSATRAREYATVLDMLPEPREAKSAR